MDTFDLGAGDVEELYGRLVDVMLSLKSGSSKSHTLRKEAIKGLATIFGKLQFILNKAKEIENQNVKPYVNIMEKDLLALKTMIFSEKELPKRFYHSQTRGGCTGVCRELQLANYTSAYWTFSSLPLYLFRFLEESKMVRSLMSSPSDLRALIRDRIEKLNYSDVIECFNLIDANFIAKHWKDCVDNCRKALMKTVEYLITDCGGKAVSSFEANLGFLVSKEIIDRIDKRDVVSTFSLLSQRSQHEELESETEMTDDDIRYLLQATYHKIQRLLDKYEAQKN